MTTINEHLNEMYRKLSKQLDVTTHPGEHAAIKAHLATIDSMISVVTQITSECETNTALVDAKITPDNERDMHRFNASAYNRALASFRYHFRMITDEQYIVKVIDDHVAWYDCGKCILPTMDQSKACRHNTREEAVADLMELDPFWRENGKIVDVFRLVETNDAYHTTSQHDIGDGVTADDALQK